MFSDKSILAIITARGGSKGIPGKNIKHLAGKPLITWTIQAALDSHNLDRVIVSTDDTNIANVCREFGAEVPFMRPNDLAQDDSPHIEIIIHVIDWLCTHINYYPEYVMLLQPTSPLRTTDDINEAINLAIKQNADGVVSVCNTPVHPYLFKKINEDGKLFDYIDKPEGYLYRQLYPPIYYVNGAIYLTRTEIIQKQRTFYPDCTFPYIMPVERSLDIDTPWDLYLADLILRDKYGYNLR